MRRELASVHATSRARSGPGEPVTAAAKAAGRHASYNMPSSARSRAHGELCRRSLGTRTRRLFCSSEKRPAVYACLDQRKCSWCPAPHILQVNTPSGSDCCPEHHDHPCLCSGLACCRTPSSVYWGVQRNQVCSDPQQGSPQLHERLPLSDTEICSPALPGNAAARRACQRQDTDPSLFRAHSPGNGQWRISQPLETALVQLKPASPRAPGRQAPASAAQGPTIPQRKAAARARTEVHRQLTDRVPAYRPAAVAPPAKVARRQPGAAPDGAAVAHVNARAVGGLLNQGVADGAQVINDGGDQRWAPFFVLAVRAAFRLRLQMAAGSDIAEP